MPMHTLFLQVNTHTSVIPARKPEFSRQGWRWDNRLIGAVVEWAVRPSRHPFLAGTLVHLGPSSHLAKCIYPGLDNEYLREREQDVRDLGRRVLRHLVRRDLSPLRHLPPDSVLVIHELLPSDVLDLDCAHLVGMVLESGSDTSHAAILTRSWGIAAVSGIADATHWIEPGAPILVDGQTGEVVVHPQPTDVERLVRRKQRYDRSVSIALAAESRECITQDGVQITLYANIARPDECAQVARHHLNGVGLFRTEYLFLDSHEAPSFQCQLEAYRNAAQCLPDQPLVIRTL